MVFICNVWIIQLYVSRNVHTIQVLTVLYLSLKHTNYKSSFSKIQWQGRADADKVLEVITLHKVTTVTKYMHEN